MTATPSTIDPKEVLTCCATVRCGFAEQTVRVRAARDRMVDAVREQASREFDWPIYAITILHGRVIPRATRCAHCGERVSDELFMLRLGCGVIAVVSIVAMGVASLVAVLMGGK